MSWVTPAERRALQAVAEHGRKKAAFALGKSPRTVQQQLESARARLGAEDIYQAMGIVLRERSSS